MKYIISRGSMRVVYNDGGRAAAGFKGDIGDCVCRSIAIASGRPYQEIYDALAHINVITPKSKRRRGKALGTRTASHGIYVQSVHFKRYMQSLGFEWTPTMRIGSGCKVHLAKGELPMGRLVVHVSRHNTAVIDGVIHDTHDPQRADSWIVQPDGTRTKIGGRCVYGIWEFKGHVGSSVE